MKCHLQWSMCGGNARGETPGSLANACPAWSGAEPYIALIVGGHDKLSSQEVWTSWQGCPLAPCRVRWWGLGHERINSMMDFEWSWTYEHIRTGVSFGLNVLSGGWQLSEAKQRQLVCELLHDSNSEGQCLQVHSWINIEPTSNYFYTVLSNNLFIS